MKQLRDLLFLKMYTLSHSASSSCSSG